ncbi:Tryptophan/Indoleamine 2,3-dioxygenase-like [Sesbania bispinosa]|nr:Tryptophan/Indoleamine 2,3-dioxygenase-like [Sesbania bispinosa]
MVDLHWKSKVLSSDMSSKSPKLSLPDKSSPRSSLPSLQLLPFIANDVSAAAPSLCAAYDHYLRLPELRRLWNTRDFPNWSNEPILKPALQALEITFRFLSTVFSDTRPYSNRREWNRRVESLATRQIEIIAMLCEDEEQDPETRGTSPMADLNEINSNSRSYSEASLLPRLATWYRSKDVAQRILLSVECQMRRCPYTLGLGEPNLAGKPSLRYDAVCRPNEIHALKTTPYDDRVENYENHAVHASHQIVESWIHASRKLLERIGSAIEGRRFEKAVEDCYAVERIWKLLAEVEDVHLMMDPGDFLKLKNQLSVRGETASFCFRSKELVEVTKMCRDLRHRVPEILEVKVDPKGGPRIQEAAMKLYVAEKVSGFEKVHLLQAMQGIEVAMKRFFYSYKQVLAVVMGSSEANGNRVGLMSCDGGDSLTHLFLEPTYFPSLDAAKTFLGYIWDNDNKWL